MHFLDHFSAITSKNLYVLTHVDVINNAGGSIQCITTRYKMSVIRLSFISVLLTIKLHLFWIRAITKDAKAIKEEDITKHALCDAKAMQHHFNGGNDNHRQEDDAQYSVTEVSQQACA
jgi:hypothetical protein